MGDSKYIVHVRLKARRQTIEDGYDLNDWDDRIEADIETEELVSEFKQVTANSLEEALDEAKDLSEFSEAGNGK